MQKGEGFLIPKETSMAPTHLQNGAQVSETGKTPYIISIPISHNKKLIPPTHRVRYSPLTLFLHYPEGVHSPLPFNSRNPPPFSNTWIRSTAYALPKYPTVPKSWAEQFSWVLSIGPDRFHVSYTSTPKHDRKHSTAKTVLHRAATSAHWAPSALETRTPLHVMRLSLELCYHYLLDPIT